MTSGAWTDDGLAEAGRTMLALLRAYNAAGEWDGTCRLLLEGADHEALSRMLLGALWEQLLLVAGSDRDVLAGQLAGVHAQIVADPGTITG